MPTLPEQAAGHPCATAASRAIGIAEAAIAVVLGTLFLGRGSFFPDEAHTWSTLERGFPDLVRLLADKEGFQILYSLVLWPLNQASSTAFALRFPSTLAWAITVPACIALGRRLWDERTALVAGLLLATNAFALQYAQEARSYTMAMMFATFAAVALTRDVLAPTEWSRPAWIGFATAAVWAHGMAVFAVAGQLASLLVLPREHLAGRRFVRGVAITALLCAPAVLAPILQLDRGEAFPAGEAPNLETFRVLVWSLAGRSVYAVVVYSLAAGVALFALGALLRRTRRRSADAWRFAMPLLWVLTPPAVLLGYSFSDHIWVERYALPGLPGLALLVAYGITRATDRRVLGAILAVTLATAGYGVVRWYDDPGWSEFDVLADDLTEQATPGDALVTATDRSRVPLEYALRDRPVRDDLEPVFPDEPWGSFRTGDQLGAPIDDAAIRDLEAGHDRVWLVSGFYDKDVDVGAQIERLGPTFVVVFHRTYAGPIDLYLLERATPL